MVSCIKRRSSLACVAGIKGKGKGKGKGGFGRAREKGKERLQGYHCFLHFSRSDSERLVE